MYRFILSVCLFSFSLSAIKSQTNSWDIPEKNLPVPTADSLDFQQVLINSYVIFSNIGSKHKKHLFIHLNGGIYGIGGGKAGLWEAILIAAHAQIPDSRSSITKVIQKAF